MEIKIILLLTQKTKTLSFPPYFSSLSFLVFFLFFLFFSFSEHFFLILSFTFFLLLDPLPAFISRELLLELLFERAKVRSSRSLLWRRRCSACLCPGAAGSLWKGLGWWHQESWRCCGSEVWDHPTKSSCLSPTQLLWEKLMAQLLFGILGLSCLPGPFLCPGQWWDGLSWWQEVFEVLGFPSRRTWVGS